MGTKVRKSGLTYRPRRRTARRGSLAPTQLLGIKIPQTENQIQEAVWAYLATVTASSGPGWRNSLQDFAFHVPNGIQLAGGSPKRRAIYMAALKRRGLKPGVMDLIILYPSICCGKLYHGMLLELKSGDGVESEEQANFRCLMSRVGYYAAVANSYARAVSYIKNYMGFPQ